MRSAPGTGARQYSPSLAAVLGLVAPALRRLEWIAASTTRLDTAGDELPRLQNELHLAGELLAGVQAAPGTELTFAELAACLAFARDATGEIAAVLDEDGLEDAALLVPEWRVALFRVRLARTRLPATRAAGEPAPRLRSPRISALTTGLALSGAAAFVTGAVVALWPVWAAGTVLVAAAVLLQR